jgi:hypothetical protein
LERANARILCEVQCCNRGEMENRIKEQQLDLFADRNSTRTLRANQLRLYLSSFADILLYALRNLGLRDTELQQPQCGAIRTKLLKSGAGCGSQCARSQSPPPKKISLGFLWMVPARSVPVAPKHHWCRRNR